MPHRQRSPYPARLVNKVIGREERVDIPRAEAGGGGRRTRRGRRRGRRRRRRGRRRRRWRRGRGRRRRGRRRRGRHTQGGSGPGSRYVRSPPIDCPLPAPPNVPSMVHTFLISFPSTSSGWADAFVCAYVFFFVEMSYHPPEALRSHLAHTKAKAHAQAHTRHAHARARAYAHTNNTHTHLI